MENQELVQDQEPQAAPAAVVEEGEAGDLSALRDQLADAQAKAGEYLDGWQRARAEFVNYRRREEQRRKQEHQNSKSRLLSRLLPVLDDLDRAFQAIPSEVREDSWVQGLSLVEHKLQNALEKEGLAVLPVQPGDAFDPVRHEAITHEPCADYDAGHVIGVLQRGYTLEDAVLRPAMVRVSSGKPGRADEPGKENEQTGQ
jgi:molecular chaperone GrpE